MIVVPISGQTSTTSGPFTCPSELYEVFPIPGQCVREYYACVLGNPLLQVSTFVFPCLLLLLSLIAFHHCHRLVQVFGSSTQKRSSAPHPTRSPACNVSANFFARLSFRPDNVLPWSNQLRRLNRRPSPAPPTAPAPSRPATSASVVITTVSTGSYTARCVRFHNLGHQLALPFRNVERFIYRHVPEATSSIRLPCVAPHLRPASVSETCPTSDGLVS